jgi:hypothetical protein
MCDPGSRIACEGPGLLGERPEAHSSGTAQPAVVPPADIRRDRMHAATVNISDYRLLGNIHLL